MADVFPIDTASPAIARLDVPLAQLDLDLQALAVKRAAAERERAGLLAEQHHQVYDLDADSAYTIPGACYGSYLNHRTGGVA